MTNPTPNKIRDLARAALAWNQKSKDFKPNNTERAEAIRDWMAFHEAMKDPALIIALCDRLDPCRQNLAALGDSSHAAYMTTPLAPSEAGGRP